MSKTRIIWMASIFIVSLVLRFYKLGSQPLWIDEALLYNWITNHIFVQEQFGVFIGSILPKTEFWLRFPTALFGSILSLLPFLVFKKDWLAISTSIFLGVFPLFVFWSRVARPYMLSSLFIGLQFTQYNKFRIFNVLALLCTPFAILGYNIHNIFKNKEEWLLFLLFLCLSLFLFYSRPDSDKDFFNVDFLLMAKRLWVIPIISLIFNLGLLIDKIKIKVHNA